MIERIVRIYHSLEIAIHWVGYYVSVQYMDDNGNLSAVYQDDISVEGHP